MPGLEDFIGETTKKNGCANFWFPCKIRVRIANNEDFPGFGIFAAMVLDENRIAAKASSLNKLLAAAP